MSGAGDSKVTWALGLLLAAAVAGMVIGGARLLGIDLFGPAASNDPLIGAEAPDITLTLVSGEGEGDHVQLSALRGEIVVLDFWASWCGPCRMSIPALNEVHERYGGRVRMYGVNVQPELSADGVRAAHRDFGAVFPSLHDPRQEAQSLYGITSIPTLVIVDRAGVVRHVERGVPDADDVGDRLDELLFDSEAESE